MKVAIVAVLVSLMACVSMVQASQMYTQPQAPWIGYANGTTIDISKAFDLSNGPIVINGDPREFVYWYSPYGGVTCPGVSTAPQAAMCQKADRYYSTGSWEDPLWIEETRGVNWRILYPDGTSWRITQFNFIVDSTVETTTIKFVNESPYEQYNFEVRGKCLGQQHSACNYN